ncbi:nitrilase-related carbon-nitrogen hydrolase, partial [Streptomyces celluloflavus]
MIIAAAQFSPVPLDIDANAARMAALVTEAAGRGAGLVVFAELALTQYDTAAIAAAPRRRTVTPDDARLAPVRGAGRAAGGAAAALHRSPRPNNPAPRAGSAPATPRPAAAPPAPARARAPPP